MPILLYFWPCWLCCHCYLVVEVYVSGEYLDVSPLECTVGFFLVHIVANQAQMMFLVCTLILPTNFHLYIYLFIYLHIVSWRNMEEK